MDKLQRNRGKILFALGVITGLLLPYLPRLLF